MTRLLGFARDRGNPYIIYAPGIKLHNLITKQLADDYVAVRHCTFKQMVINWSANSGRNGSWRRQKNSLPPDQSKNLPQLDCKPNTEMATAPITVSSKMMTAAEIVRERGMPIDCLWPRCSPSFNHI